MTLKYKNSNFHNSTISTIFGEVKISKNGDVEVDEVLGKKLLESYLDFYVDSKSETVVIPKEEVISEPEEIDFNSLDHNELMDLCIESGIEKAKIENIKDKNVLIKLLKKELVKK